MSSSENIRTRLTSKEVPFLVTIFFASLGWTVIHIVDRIVDSPSVEITRSSEQAADGSRFVVTLQNLSGKNFRNFTFEIFDRNQQNILSSPDFLDPEFGEAIRNTPEVISNSVDFQIAQLQPGWQISMSVRYSGTRWPQVQLKNAPDGEPIKLVDPSFDTWFAHHEEGLMFSMALLWLGFICLLLFVL